MLSIQGLTKRYDDVPVLNGVDLELAEGEVLGLLGRNGAGKTTLLSIISGLLSAGSGSVLLDGVDVISDRSTLLTALGFVPQDLAIYPTLTVTANLRFGADLKMVPRREVKADIDRVAERLLLGELLDRKAGELSGGEKRRLHAAIGLLGKPRLVLLDEPTVGADAVTRNQLLEAVRELAVEDGAACVYTSHYTPEVEAIADRVAILHHGVIRTTGTVSTIVANEGRAQLRLTFSEALQSEHWDHEMKTQVELDTDFPSETLAKVLADLGDNAAALQSVDIVRKSLESAYLALTEGDES